METLTEINNFPGEEIGFRRNEVDYDKGMFHDISNPDHRLLYLNHLLAGRVGANESYGPFGFAVMLDLGGRMEENGRRVDSIGIVKEGRDMRVKPPTIMIPDSEIDEVVDFVAMAGGDVERSRKFRAGIGAFLKTTGTFAEVALKRGFAGLLPISTRIARDGREISTAILACIDNSYPYLAEIVRGGWERNHVMAISSANRTGCPTETTPEGVRNIVKGKPELQVMILDNWELRQAFALLEGLEPCSYTILQATTGWSVDRNDRYRFGIMRQGNVSPGRVLDGMRSGFQEGLMVGQFGLDESKILVGRPYCNLSRDFPPKELRQALGFTS